MNELGSSRIWLGKCSNLEDDSILLIKRELRIVESLGVQDKL